MKKLILAVALLIAAPAWAQTQPPAPLFSVSTQAIAVRLNGASNPGTDLIGSYNLTKHVVLQTDNLIVPAISMDAHYGGVRYNFDLKKVVAKTNIPKDTFQPYVHGAIGIVRNSPATGPTLQRYSALAGGGFDYDPTGNGRFSFGPRIEYSTMPGFGKSPTAVVVSANLTVVLGSK